jgi:hypothetical protein
MIRWRNAAVRQLLTNLPVRGQNLNGAFMSRSCVGGHSYPCPIPVGNHHEPFLGQSVGGMKFRGFIPPFVFF